LPRHLAEYQLQKYRLSVMLSCFCQKHLFRCFYSVAVAVAHFSPCHLCHSLCCTLVCPCASLCGSWESSVMHSLLCTCHRYTCHRYTCHRYNCFALGKCIQQCSVFAGIGQTVTVARIVGRMTWVMMRMQLCTLPMTSSVLHQGTSQH